MKHKTLCNEKNILLHKKSALNAKNFCNFLESISSSRRWIQLQLLKARACDLNVGRHTAAATEEERVVE